MAKYSNDFDQETRASNVLDVSLLGGPRFSPAMLSDDGKTMVVFGGPGGQFLFQSEAGFTAPWIGTITSIVLERGIRKIGFEPTLVDMFSSRSESTGFALDGAVVRDAIADGDSNALNQLIWGRNDQITGGAGLDTLRGFAGNDKLDGGAGNDRLLGDAGNDRVLGGDGNDVMFGGSGTDRLFGGVGNDVIFGGTGDDLIGGGGGSDQLSGGAGADTFVYSGFGQFGIGYNPEIISDFSRAQGDKIDLSAIDTDAALMGDQAFRFIDGTGGLVPTGARTSLVGDVLASAGDLIISNSDFDDGFRVTLYIADPGAEGGLAAYQFDVVARDGVLTADDFIL